MEQSFSWEAKHPSATQDIYGILCKLYVNYLMQKRGPSVPNQNWINPLLAPFPSHLLKKHFNIIPPSRPWFYKLFFLTTDLEHILKSSIDTATFWSEMCKNTAADLIDFRLPSRCKSALFWEFTQRIMIVSYWILGTTHRYYLPQQSLTKRGQFSYGKFILCFKLIAVQNNCFTESDFPRDPKFRVTWQNATDYPVF